MSDILNCPNCKKIYDEPKMLPCGKVVCTDCLSIILYKVNRTSKEFKCLLCTEYHSLPKSGKFPTCEPLMNLIRKKPNDIFRCEALENLRSNLKQIQHEVVLLKKDMNNGNEKIKKYCHELRTDVQLAVEMKINEINNLNAIMIDTIDNYEIECFNAFEKETLFKDKTLKETAEIGQFCSDWIDSCKHMRLSEMEVLKANELAKSMKIKMNLKRKEFDSFLFNNKVLVFEKSLHKMEPAELGVLKYENRVKTTSIFCDDLEEINFKAIVPDWNECHSPASLCVEFIEKTKLFMAYRSSTNRLNYLIMDIQQKSLVYSSIEKQDRVLSNVKTVNKNLIVIDVVDAKDGCNYLKILDDKLNMHYEIKIFGFRLVGVDDANIYCISNNSSTYNLRIYNTKLKYLNSVGQSNDVGNKYYFSPDLKQIMQKNKTYYWLNETNLHIVGGGDGRCLKTIPIKADGFFVDSKDNLVCFSRESRKLSYFNLDGVLLYLVELLNFSHNFLFVSNTFNDQVLHFFDTNKLSLLI